MIRDRSLRGCAGVYGVLFKFSVTRCEVEWSTGYEQQLISNEPKINSVPDDSFFISLDEMLLLSS